MAQDEEMSALFPVFILSILAIVAIPWTVYRVSRSFEAQKSRALRCHCSLCNKAPKNQPTVVTKISNFLSVTNVVLIIMWLAILALTYHVRMITQEIQTFEPYSILGLEPGATDSQIKKAYYRLSRQYHPDKNPDPVATKYFVDYISKAYEALTDEVAKKNLEEYGHPDGRQAMNVGIALPKFMLDMQGPQGAIFLMIMVLVGILLPLVVVMIYLSYSAKYTGNNIMQQTLYNYYHLIKPSLAPSKVLEVILYSGEFLEMPVRRKEGESLQKLFTEVRSEIISEAKNLKQDTAKFWEKHPSIIKAELLLLTQMSGMPQIVQPVLQPDFKSVLEVFPKLIEEFVKMCVMPRSSNQLGYLRPALGALELSQNVIQGIPLSARRDRSGDKGSSTVTEGSSQAAFLQLPHVTEGVVKKIARQRIRTLADLQDLPGSERDLLLTQQCGLSQSEAEDLARALAFMPRVEVETSMEVQGEKGDILEGDLVTFRAWVTVSRGLDGTRQGGGGSPHAPLFPFQLEERYWVFLADLALNTVYVAQRVTFGGSPGDSVAAVAKQVRETMEGEGKAGAEVAEAVKAATERVRAGARLALGKFVAPEEGAHALTVMCVSDVWLGCDKKVGVKVKVGRRSRAGTRVPGLVPTVTREDGEEGERAEEEEEEEEEEEDVDEYESEYSEEEDAEVPKEASGKKGGKRGRDAGEEAEGSK